MNLPNSKLEPPNTKRNPMFIYNVTTKITPAIHEAWVRWMKEIHIPDVMNTHCFTDHRFVRILEIDDSEGPTYAVQFFAESKANYNNYLENHAPVMRKDVLDNWGADFISFRSLMELVN